MNRVAGLETEYGCLSDDPSGSPSAVGRVRTWIFEGARFRLPDIHQRDWDEPAGNGGFLFNGYLQDLRIYKGVAKYGASSFTPPDSIIVD